MSYERCKKCIYSFCNTLCEYEKIKANGKLVHQLKDHIGCSGYARDVSNDKSGVEIRLVDHKNNKVMYGDLTNEQLEKIIEIINDEWV